MPDGPQKRALLVGRRIGQRSKVPPASPPKPAGAIGTPLQDRDGLRRNFAALTGQRIGQRGASLARVDQPF